MDPSTTSAPPNNHREPCDYLFPEDKQHPEPNNVASAYNYFPSLQNSHIVTHIPESPEAIASLSIEEK